MLKKTVGIFTFVMMSFFAAQSQAQNELSGAESTNGWRLLFDGKTSTGWHTYNKKIFGPSWKVVDGTLFCDTSYHVPKGEEGDICTDGIYKDFDLKYEWKIAKDGNSGVMFLVQESPQYSAPYLTGPEMQVLDNDGHPDGKIHKHRAGDLYDLIASSSEPVHKVGDWNQAEIKLVKGHLTFFLNGVQVVSTTLWDKQWDELVAGSKFSKMPGFAKSKSGHIDLQNHQCNVWFRNIKIKEL
jgi:Domain of Unknown Function (DUF1080)